MLPPVVLDAALLKPSSNKYLLQRVAGGGSREVYLQPIGFSCGEIPRVDCVEMSLMLLEELFPSGSGLKELVGWYRELGVSCTSRGHMSFNFCVYNYFVTGRLDLYRPGL